ncbi:MAG: hypothetical protein U1E39_11825 [Planctomycetota bacterium]
MRTVASPPARPTRGRLVAAAALVVLAAAAAPARGGDPGSATGCVVPVFVDDDATLVKAYDGLRLGLEEANLPRACRKAPATDDAAGWALAAREVRDAGAPFVVAMGRGASASVAATAFEGATGRLPCVSVDVAVSLGFAAFPDAPRRPAPFATVRSELPLERLARVVLDLLPGRPTPTALLPWTQVPADVAALLARAEASTGVRWSTDASVPPDVILDLPLGAGETREPFAGLVARARSLRVPLLSMDRARFGEGAAVVVVPDAALLGRVTAEAARRASTAAPGDEPVRLVVRTTEVWVDLEAAAAEGLDPPLPFLARADRLRRARPAAAPAGGGR